MARKYKPQVRYDGDASKFPSARYSALDRASCHAELSKRGISFTVEEGAKGVLAPVRVRDRISGVLFKTTAPPDERERTPYEVFDCRLVLSLSDWSPFLLERDIDEVLFFSAWRPPPKSFPSGKLGTRHPGALAIDVFRFGKRQIDARAKREWIDVERDFRGRLKTPVCGKTALKPPSKNSKALSKNGKHKTLRELVCATAEAHLFTSILTPNYDRAHKNHLHLEIAPNVSWYLVR